VLNAKSGMAKGQKQPKMIINHIIDWEEKKGISLKNMSFVFCQDTLSTDHKQMMVQS